MALHEGMVTHPNGPNAMKVEITRQDSTDIDFTDGLRNRPGKEWLPADAFLIVDSEINTLHGDWINSLRQEARGLFIMPGGDENKTPQKALEIIDACVKNKVSRRGTLVGVGGGVTTDTTGLAANLYYRGVNAEYVPTTLLAMVDAAIGGKVGVNHPSHKNLIGSFYQPKRVLIDPNFIQTQSNEQILSGLGEVVKIAMVASQELFELLDSAKNVPDLLRNHCREMIRICIERKIRMLGENCYERSFERILNFGHSVGHPLEDVTHFRIPHGIAVGMGMATASHIAMQRQMFPQSEFERVIGLMKKLGLPLFDAQVDEEEVWRHVEQLVLQRGGEKLHYVVPDQKIGQATIIDNISKDEFLTAVHELRLSQVTLQTSSPSSQSH